MQYAYFQSQCDLELGDVVIYKPDGNVYTIEDIYAIHSVKANAVVFRFILINSKGETMSSLVQRNDIKYPIE